MRTFQGKSKEKKTFLLRIRKRLLKYNEERRIEEFDTHRILQAKMGKWKHRIMIVFFPLFQHNYRLY